MTDAELLGWTNRNRPLHVAHLAFIEKCLKKITKCKTPAAAYSREFFNPERDKTQAALGRSEAAMPAREAALAAYQAAADELAAHCDQPPATNAEDELRFIAVRNILGRKVNEARATLEAATRAAEMPHCHSLMQYLYVAETDTDDLVAKSRQVSRYELGYTNPVSDMVVLQAKAASLGMLPFYAVAEAAHRGDPVLAPLFAERWRIAAARNGIGQEPAPSPSNYEMARDAAQAAE
jgi:hypothetical protein